MCVLAIADLPYGYYQLLKWVVCISALWSAFIARSTARTAWVAIFSGVAVLFNPIAPIHLDRQIWAFLDIVTAAVLVVSLWAVRDRHGSSSSAT